MKKTNVVVCDICEDKLATTKCEICKREICKTCFRYLDFNYHDDMVLKIKRGKISEEKIPFCKECISKLGLLFNDCAKEFSELWEKDQDDLIEKIIHERKKRLGEHLVKGIRDFIVSEKI